MCGKDSLSQSSSSAPVQVSTSKLRPLNELRCDYWKRRTDTLSTKCNSSAPSEESDSSRTFKKLEDLVQDFDKQKHASDSLSDSNSTSNASLRKEAPSRFRNLEDLQREYKERQLLHAVPSRDEQLQVQKPKMTSYGRSALLAFRQTVSQQKREDQIGIWCVPRSSSLAWKTSPTKMRHHVEDPQLDDMKLLVRMEERLARECGADAKNDETFGGDLEPWSFEEAVAANEKLFGVPVKEFDLCLSTAAGSRVQSECQSCNSENSTPRASQVLDGTLLSVFS